MTRDGRLQTRPDILYKFLFQGQLIRESAKTNSKTVAREAERARRRDLELGINRIGKRERTPLFRIAAKEWIDAKVGKSESTLRNYRQYVESLTSEFKDRLICDIDIADIRALQRKRLTQGLGHRSVNYEIGVLRQILKPSAYGTTCRKTWIGSERSMTLARRSFTKTRSTCTRPALRAEVRHCFLSSSSVLMPVCVRARPRHSAAEN